MKRMMTYFLFMLSAFVVTGCFSGTGNYVHSDEDIEIFPDYADVTIPYNIAPLNFKFLSDFDRYVVELKGEEDSYIRIRTKGIVQFKQRQWREFTNQNRGKTVEMDVFAKADGQWHRFPPVSIIISDQAIDSHLAYRLIAPGYEAWSKMGIYQRDLTSFREDVIVDNTLFVGGCMNCHSFNQNSNSQMMFHLRGQGGGTILAVNDEVIKLNTKTDNTIGNFQYPYWHPSGNFIAYSVNNTAQVFHANDPNRVEVFDSESDLLVYDIRRNLILTSDLIASKDWFETWPAFSPEGDYLYFTTTPALPMPESFDKMKYSLCRIAFNSETGAFGNQVDTLVSSSITGKSVAFPRISPDGKFLMYTKFEYGNFPIWHRDADLYLIDLESGERWNMEGINSDETDSYHSWSSNSRWVVFSSRRVNGLYTHPHIAFVDENGKTGKPFILPQQHPDHYDRLLFSYNIPEMVNGSVKLNISDLEDQVVGSGKNVAFYED